MVKFPRRTFISALSVVLGILALSGSGLVQARETDGDAQVRLIIDYGSGVEKHWTQIEWVDGITALGAMEQASNLPDPLALEIDVRGKGTMAFVRSIDGMNNEGGGAVKRNWIFRVNGELASQSCGVTVLETGDVVRWTFGKYKMDDKDGD